MAPRPGPTRAKHALALAYDALTSALALIAAGAVCEALASPPTPWGVPWGSCAAAVLVARPLLVRLYCIWQPADAMCSA